MSVAFLLLSGSPGVIADDTEKQRPWGLGETYYVKRGNRYPKGKVLYMTGKKSLGVVFRCDSGKVYTYLVVKEMNMEDIITFASEGARRWKVAYSIDGGEEHDEEWVSVHHGMVYLVANRETSHRIFAMAEHGMAITVTPRRGKPVTINIPRDEDGLFDPFRRACGYVGPNIRASIT